MKSTFNLLHLAAILVIVGLATTAWKPQAAASAQAPVSSEAACATGRSVQVSGAAVVNVTPDRALLQLGVQSNGA